LRILDAERKGEWREVLITTPANGSTFPRRERRTGALRGSGRAAVFRGWRLGQTAGEAREIDLGVAERMGGLRCRERLSLSRPAGRADPQLLTIPLGVCQRIGCRLKGVSEASRHDNDESAEPVFTFEELAEAIKHAPPPTDDDVSITWDGRAINSKEKLLAVLKEVEANRKAGVTFEELRQRPGAWGKNGNWTVDWDWDPLTDPRA
jgi:hypothetical protein